MSESSHKKSMKESGKGQRHMRNVEEDDTKKKTSGIFGVGVSIDDLVEIIEKDGPKIRRPVTVEPIENLRGLKTKFMDVRGKRQRFTRVLGAAGESLVPVQKLKVVSDPYDSETRKFFALAALTDPILSQALDRRNESMFENGLEYRFKLASAYDPKTGMSYSPEQIQQLILTQSTAYATVLQRLITWASDQNILQLARDLESVSFNQGKAAGLIFPGIMELPQGQLPLLAEIITVEDLSDPIIDVGFTRKLVAVKLNLEDKTIARVDELVYITRGKRGLRREAKFQGTSPLEPIFYISKIVKRLYNLDMSEAAVFAYITRLLFRVRAEGDEDEQKKKIQDFLKALLTSGKIAFAMTDDVTEVKEVPVKVDWPMLDGVESKLADVEIGITGVPTTMMNRTQSSNRDLATIQAIQFVRFVRKPAEAMVLEALENQLFNPLLVHLTGKALAELPVRIEIVRKIPPEGDIDVLYDRLSQQKNQEINTQSLAQVDQQTPFGAAARPGGSDPLLQSSFQAIDEIKKAAKAIRDNASQNSFIKK